MPPIGPRKPPLNQLKVLQILIASGGFLTRVRIAEAMNCSAVYVGKAIGPSDPVARAAFERTREVGGTPEAPVPTLLTRGFIIEKSFDIDGLKETVFQVTEEGIAYFNRTKHFLDPIH